MIEEYFNYLLKTILYLPNDLTFGLERNLHFQMKGLMKQRACIRNLHLQRHIRPFYDEIELIIQYFEPN